MQKNKSLFLVFLASILCVCSAGVSALELDWGGQFRSEAHWIQNYTMDVGATTPDTVRAAAGGYYVPPGGVPNAHFQSLFLKLYPKIIVNDNIYLKSEWWVGDPIFGFYGSGAPYTADGRQYYSTQSRGSTITGQRYWAEFLSDVGTVQIGRAPLDWGLGVVWSSGEGTWSRYPSTGDVIRLLSKFGAFIFSPTIVKYSTGNTIGGAYDTTNFTNVAGHERVSDYSLAMTYEDVDEDFKFGVNFIKRLAGAAQGAGSGYLGVNGRPVGLNYNTWDLFLNKIIGPVSLGLEAPISGGDIGGIKYSSYALAFESKWRITDSWDLDMQAGRAPGQVNGESLNPSSYKAFYFHPDYRLGLIMFNYQLANFRGPNTQNTASTLGNALLSPFDNPITNANYVTIMGRYKVGKWGFRLKWIYAKADVTAKQSWWFFNSWNRRFYQAALDQSSNSLGWEADGGLTFNWDDYFQFHWDFGWYFPGKYYEFSNTTLRDNPAASVFAMLFRVGVNF